MPPERDVYVKELPDPAVVRHVGMNAAKVMRRIDFFAMSYIQMAVQHNMLDFTRVSAGSIDRINQIVDAAYEFAAVMQAKSETV